MVDIFVKNEGMTFFEPINNDGICINNTHARERTTCANAVSLIEAAVIINRHHNRNTKFHAGDIVVHTMSRSRVNNTGTIIERNVISVNKFARLALVAKDWKLVTRVRKFFSACVPGASICVLRKLKGIIAKFLAAALNQGFRHDFAAAIYNDSNVCSFRMKDNAVVRRQGPRSRCPNVDP